MASQDTLPPEIAALAAADAEAPPSTEMIDRVREKLRVARDKQLELAELEQRAKDVKTELFTLRHKTLPDLMGLAKIDNLGLPPEGNHPAYDCRLLPWSEARLPEGQEDVAYVWLEKEGYGDIVKHTFTVALDRGSDKLAKAVRDLLTNTKIPFEEKRAVHFQTLQAWVREQLRKGTPLPADKLGLTIGQHVKVEERGEPTTRKRGK